MALTLGPADRLRRGLLFTSLRVPVSVRLRLTGPPPINDRGQPLDPGTWWVLWLETRFAPGLARGEPEASRRHTRASAALVERDPRPLASVEDLRVAGLPARRYHPGGGPRRLLLYLHGGGWAVGDLDTHDALCRRLAAEVGLVVVSLDYRLAPEHPFPAAVDDGVAALREVQERAGALGGRTDGVLIGGDSAGGNLSAVACQRLRDGGEPLPLGQLLIYPATDLRRAFPSHRTLAHGYFLQKEDMDWFLDQYAAEPLDPAASPLLASSLAGLPPAIVTTAGFDPLRDEGEAYARELAHAGVPVVHLHEPGLVHGYVSMETVVPEADAALGRIVDALKAWT
jgi:acetyl esterase